ncbi:MAG TPA: EamA family transporter [Acidimicrobiales bacterium]|nr:EamA family transporter [Acidimicrobiales bacterium]
MTRRGWILFVAMSVIWGVPYLLIKVAVEDLSPTTLVAARTSLAFVVLAPIAVSQGALKPVLRYWRPLVAFSAIEMAGPWLLLTDAEQKLPSGLTGLLVATVPLVGALLAFLLGDRSVLRPVRLLGLTVGIAGVALLVGLGGDEGSVDAFSVVEVLLVAVGYATAPFIASHKLSSVPSMGVITASIGLVALVYLPAGIAQAPNEWPSADVAWSVVGLAVVCTALAFVVFFALIGEVGPTRATLITFANPAVAVVLGVVVLGEAITPGLVVGFPLVLAGCWLASQHEEVDEPLEAEALAARG